MKKIILIIIIIFLSGCSKNKFVGKWEQNILYNEGTEGEREYYGTIELTEDYKCIYYGYDIGKEDKKKQFNGIYKIIDDKAYCFYDENDDFEDFFYELYISEDGERLCNFTPNCEDYYVKSTSKIDNHIKLSDV